MQDIRAGFVGCTQLRFCRGAAENLDRSGLGIERKPLFSEAQGNSVMRATPRVDSIRRVDICVDLQIRRGDVQTEVLGSGQAVEKTSHMSLESNGGLRQVLRKEGGGKFDVKPHVI